MKNISELKRYPRFHDEGRIVFEKFLSTFLNCHVNIQIHKIDEFEKGMGIDVTTNVLRNCYDWHSKTGEMIIVPKVYGEKPDDIIAILPIRLSGAALDFVPRNYFEKITRTISHYLSRCYAHKFQGSKGYFGKEFERDVMSSCILEGAQGRDTIGYLLALIQDLSCTTFEGKFFSTGFIFTRSEHDYARNNRNGTLIKLATEKSILKDIVNDKRFWYLSDGSSNIYLVNSELKIRNMYIANNMYTNFLDAYSLSRTLLGSDVLFRVTGPNQISVVKSDKIEVCYTENQWKFRNYNYITDTIAKHSSASPQTVDAILSHVLYCSHNQVSSILWLPDDCSSKSLSKVLVSMKPFFNSHISICEDLHKQIVRRLISSDGVTIINHEGKIICHGAIVNLNQVSSQGQMGTGESATKLLAANGIAIKISQDGNIKIYYDSDDCLKTLVF